MLLPQTWSLAQIQENNTELIKVGSVWPWVIISDDKEKKSDTGPTRLTRDKHYNEMARKAQG